MPIRRWCLLLLLRPLVLGADPAALLYQQARQAERQDQVLEAFALYARAAGLRPGDPKYWAGLQRLRLIFAQNLAALSPARAAITVAAPGQPGQPAPDSPPPTAAELREAERPAPPVQLRPPGGRRTFDLRGDARSLYEQVAGAYGIRVVFDPDYSPGPSLRFSMADVTFREAIRALMALSGSFVVPLDERSLLVAADNPQKRNELERYAAALLPIPLVMSVEEANEIGRAVQQVLDIRRLAVDANRRQVYVRDTVTRVRLASALYEELSRRRAEVLIDLELVSAARSDLVNLGTTLPTTFPIFNFSTFGNHRPPADAGPLARIGGGQTLLGIRIADAAVQADWARTYGQLLSRFQLRATEGLPATLHIGDRYPIVNAIFSPIVITDQIRNLQNQGQLVNPFPSFTFEDLGLILKVTPRVHDRREISLTMEAEFRVLAGTSVNGLPVISTRKFSSAVRLREGESSVVSGLSVLQQIRTRSGFAPLASIPLLGHWFSRSSWQIDQSELLLSITPHLTVPPPGDQFFSRSYHTGTESRPLPPI